MLSLKSTLLFAASAAAKIYYAGVSESGGEFGVYSSTATKGTGLPGTFGVDYAFLNASTVDIWVDQNKVCLAIHSPPNLLANKHQINPFRVAFLLERMCPVSYGLGKKFNETYFGYYNDAITAITNKGAYAILDPHNYMRYNDPSQQPATGSVIGNTTDPAAATTAQFQAFWQELAGRYKSNEHVIFGIMNEVSQDTEYAMLHSDQ